MTKAKQVIRILVADDHAIFRDGLRKLLEAADEIQIVGEASRRDNHIVGLEETSVRLRDIKRTGQVAEGKRFARPREVRKNVLRKKFTLLRATPRRRLDFLL